MNISRKISTLNLKYHFNKLVKGRGLLQTIATHCIEISPQQTEIIRPSIFIEDELKKIKKLHPETTWEAENLRIYGGTATHDATLCWQLDNVYITNRDIFKKNFKLSYPSIAAPKAFKTTFEYDSSLPLSMTSSNMGIKYFGHWLTDDCCTYLLAEDHGLPISIESDLWPDKAQYASYFGHEWDKQFIGHAKKLLLFTDYSQNESKSNRYRLLREKIRHNAAPKNIGGRVYLKRGHTGKNIRILVNEEELIKYLRKDGFTIIDITTDTFQNMIEMLLDCDLVITIEGSHQQHIMYTLAENGKIINLQPPKLFNNAVKDCCDAMGFRHGFTICEDTEGGFRVDIKNLQKIIDLLQNKKY